MTVLIISIGTLGVVQMGTGSLLAVEQLGHVDHDVCVYYIHITQYRLTKCPSPTTRFH